MDGAGVVVLAQEVPVGLGLPLLVHPGHQHPSCTRQPKLHIKLCHHCNHKPVLHLSRLRWPLPALAQQQLEQLSIQGETSSSITIQPVTTIVTSSKSMGFPSHPGKGSYGDKCVVKANHFFVELPDKDLHQYDRVSLVYTAGPLLFTSNNFEIALYDKKDGAAAQRRERPFKVVIKFAARADLHHLELVLSGKQAKAPQEALQVLDIVLRESPTASYLPVGWSFYPPDLGERHSLVPPAYYAHLAAFRARCYMEPETSDSGSMASGAAGRGAPIGVTRSTRVPGSAVVRPLPALKENVERVMFYC
ncbi:hypothetical protein J5N97_026589 [Dioscorea zingiberensis]|uniref:Protein argonaute N-terminal domain-containing protein n=1 Tax=Dioscorea zingiberensis TaxID=325984 RepID=A0A9D5C2D5_9LILI|nr:hypothetical protein J5N97_026589 [Dioscorea zingiberensis]